MNIVTRVENFTNPLYLESGRILEPYQIIYETYGKLNRDKSNVIVITHALTGSHHCAGRYGNEAKAGWWDNLIGKGKAIDTDRYFIICANVIGSNFGSTSPKSKIYPSEERYRLKFPVVTIKDMVRAQKILFNKLGIYKVKAIIGGSMGGMQALEFAVSYPTFAEIIIPIATTPMTRAWTLAFNKVAIDSIINDPEFKNGYYEIDNYNGSGLAIARMGGYISYLSPTSMESKFSRNYVETDGIYELFGRYQVERYLEYNGYNFPKWFDPLCYLYLMKAINIFDLSRGFDSLRDAIALIQSKLHLIALKEDYLFNPKEMRELYDISRDLPNKDLIHIYEVDSSYGHDAFLVEVDKFENHIVDILEDRV
jgi:homoserine O-acetyltransferase